MDGKESFYIVTHIQGYVNRQAIKMITAAAAMRWPRRITIYWNSQDISDFQIYQIPNVAY